MNPIILVVPIITTLIFLIAWLYEYKQRESKERDLTKATLTNANLSEALKAANTQASIDSFNAKAARAISRDACSDLIKLQAELEATKVKLDAANEWGGYFAQDNDKVRDAYKDLIAMPRRKRDALIKELRAANN
jgi:DnaJ-domain-containing protein 1